MVFLIWVHRQHFLKMEDFTQKFWERFCLCTKISLPLKLILTPIIVLAMFSLCTLGMGQAFLMGAWWNGTRKPSPSDNLDFFKILRNVWFWSLESPRPGPFVLAKWGKDPTRPDKTLDAQSCDGLGWSPGPKREACSAKDKLLKV